MVVVTKRECKRVISNCFFMLLAILGSVVTSKRGSDKIQGTYLFSVFTRTMLLSLAESCQYYRQTQVMRWHGADKISRLTQQIDISHCF